MKKMPARIRKLPWSVIFTASIAAAIIGAIVAFFIARRWGEANLGDVPTWLTFIAAAAGIPFIVYQFNLQRSQLKEQQQELEKARKRQVDQDKFLAYQVKQAEISTAALYRQQAELVTLFLDAVDAPDESEEGFSRQYPVAVVTNGSVRPIENVRAYMFIGDDEGGAPAVEAGPLSEDPRQLTFISIARASGQEIIYAEEQWGFKFGYPVLTDGSDEPDIYVEFTDDAGNTWRLSDRGRLRMQQPKRRPAEP
jgi:hypothetical protein